MKYGLIGEHLSHSYSREIHAKIGAYPYELCELAPTELDAFFAAREFDAINVTIPYKQSVIPYLAKISPAAKKIGAVNTVVNRGGVLYGYNTDFEGMCSLAAHAGVDMAGKKVLILGTGGTSRTAAAVAGSLGAARVIRVSRSERDGAVSYERAIRDHRDAGVLINTTPVGMYPNTDGTPIALVPFQRLDGVLDAIYHPLRTEFILEAEERGIPAEGGLRMLVRQAVAAAELFFDGKIPVFDEKTRPSGTEIPAFSGRSRPSSTETPISGGARELAERITREMLAEKRNLVLIGMPGAGKSTVGRRVAKRLGKPFFDTDEEILQRIGMPIADFFAARGEAAFRDLESDVIRTLSAKSGAVIATGGGAILRRENVRELKKNGLSVFLDRDPARIVPTADRPLSSGREALQKLYSERYSRYLFAADRRVEANGDVESVTDAVLEAAKR